MLLIWSGFLKNIGVVMPYVRRSKNFVAEFFKRFKWDIFPVEEYGFNFIVVYDNQNCGRIFNKNNVHSIVILTDLELECCDFEILTGDKVFKRMLPEFVRKTAKSYGGRCSVTLVDKDMSDDGMTIAERLCDMCSTVCINTKNMEKAEILCDRLLDKYGVIADVISDKSIISTDLVAVLDSFGNNYGRNCVVIDKNCKNSKGRVVNDFYIPFRIKPPFGMSNLVFAECLEAIKVIDIH